MAKTAMKNKQQEAIVLQQTAVKNKAEGNTSKNAKKKAKYSTRAYTRCQICGRPHAVLQKYGICRICFRELAYKGEIPGVKKASW